MFRAIAALTLASATAHSSANLLPSSPWWERVTVTISGDGQPQSCKFESSLKSTAAQTCDIAGSGIAPTAASASGAKAQYTRITFERRFQSGSQPTANVGPGETLLAGQVMALGIDAQGQVKSCRVVAQAGAMKSEYGCDQATAEHFEASAGSPREGASREGYMTVMVYGHSEHVV